MTLLLLLLFVSHTEVLEFRQGNEEKKQKKIKTVGIFSRQVFNHFLYGCAVQIICIYSQIN